MSDAASELQASYYERTASDYQRAHVIPGDEHFIALEYTLGLCTTVRASSLLDVGAGTGRAVAFLQGRQPSMRLVGLEPVEALRQEGHSLGITDLVGGSGEDLPFGDDEFDVVIATAVMHHVPDPSKVLAEMMRVASKAVVISDANRFGQSGLVGSTAKLALKATRLWPTYTAIRSRGKGHYISDGDGLYYSYSVYDSVDQLDEWADRTFVIPTHSASPGRKTRRYSGSLLTSRTAMLVGVKEPCFGGWAAP